MAIAALERAKLPDFSGFHWPFQPGFFREVPAFLREQFLATHPLTELDTYMSALEKMVQSIEPYSLENGLPRLIQCHRDVIRFGSRSDIPITPFITAIADQELQMHLAVDIAGLIVAHEEIISEMATQLKYGEITLVSRAQTVFGFPTYSEAAHTYARAKVYTHCDMVRWVHSRTYEPASVQMKKIMSALFEDPLYRGDHDEVDAFFDAVALYNERDVSVPIE